MYYKYSAYNFVKMAIYDTNMGLAIIYIVVCMRCTCYIELTDASFKSKLPFHARRQTFFFWT